MASRLDPESGLSPAMEATMYVPAARGTAPARDAIASSAVPLETAATAVNADSLCEALLRRLLPELKAALEEAAATAATTAASHAVRTLLGNTPPSAPREQVQGATMLGGMPPGHTASVDWTFSNSSSRPWAEGCRLRFLGGSMCPPRGFEPIPTACITEAGGKLSAKAICVAPQEPGPCEARWQLETADGSPLSPPLHLQGQVVLPSDKRKAAATIVGPAEVPTQPLTQDIPTRPLTQEMQTRPFTHEMPRGGTAEMPTVQLTPGAQAESPVPQAFRPDARTRSMPESTQLSSSVSPHHAKGRELLDKLAAWRNNNRPSGQPAGGTSPTATSAAAAAAAAAAGPAAASSVAAPSLASSKGPGLGTTLRSPGSALSPAAAAAIAARGATAGGTLRAPSSPGARARPFGLAGSSSWIGAFEAFFGGDTAFLEQLRQPCSADYERMSSFVWAYLKEKGNYTVGSEILLDERLLRLCDPALTQGQTRVKPVDVLPLMQTIATTYKSVKSVM